MLNKQFVVTSFLSGLLILAFAFGKVSNFFEIKKVTCTIDKEDACPDYVQAELNKNIGKSIFFVDMSQQLNKMSSYIPSLHQFQFRQKLPNEMSVNFISASPKYVVKLSNSENLFVIDETGTVIDQVEQTSLPIITLPAELYPSLTLRATIDSQLNSNLLSMFIELEKHQIALNKITLLNKDELQLELSDQKVAQLSVSNLALQVDKLAYVLANINFSSIKQPVKQIDLRFRYPVLKT